VGFSQGPFAPSRTLACDRQPLAEALASFFLVVAALCAVFGSSVSFAHRRIVSPLLSLRDAVIQLTQGKLDRKVEVRSAGELGILAASLQQHGAATSGFSGNPSKRQSRPRTASFSPT